jgi:hypothetical protein
MALRSWLFSVRRACLILSVRQKKHMPTHKRQIGKQFLNDMQRTRELFSILVEHGSSRYDPKNPGIPYGTPRPLRNVDKRDMASFLFLEAAAKFEGFCAQAFADEVASWYEITLPRADFVMGSSDNGTERTFGWSDPNRLEKRGANVFPAYRFFGDFKNKITPAVFTRLEQAKKIRNRIAHDPTMAREPIDKLATALGVPTAGMSIGRLLL